MHLIMLGTGCATAQKCYNTCFALENGREYFLVDAGGGNGIFRQLDSAGIACSAIRHMFVTHCHTDHLLGAIWVVRYIAMFMLGGKYHGNFTIYCHQELAAAIRTICGLTLPANHLELIGARILLEEVADGETREAAGMRLTFFDLHANKARQYGFRAELSGGRSLVCLGDEPYQESSRKYVQDCDWLLTEAFCLYADRDVFKPYEKQHSTVPDAAKLAESLHVGSLVLYHTEDTRLAERKKLYSAEAGEFFSGRIFVPDDLEVIELG